MTRNRIEAFSDGVLAIVITIMVFGLKPPATTSLLALQTVLPTFFCYVLSFVYVGIYWNNHHHLLHAVHTVNGAILWSNLHLLFWLSLFPFVTQWMGENPEQSVPTVLYGIVLLAAALAYNILQRTIVTAHGKASTLQRVLGSDWKGRTSPILYAVGSVVAFFKPWVGQVAYVLVALLWLIPDRRIVRGLELDKHP